jgi:hypothetical protein
VRSEITLAIHTPECAVRGQESPPPAQKCLRLAQAATTKPNGSSKRRRGVMIAGELLDEVLNSRTVGGDERHVRLGIASPSEGSELGHATAAAKRSEQLPLAGGD